MSDEHVHSHPEPAPSPPEPALVEDAGSRALTEALRSSFFVIQVIMAILVLVFLFSGFFKVGPQERAVVLHFGAPSVKGNDALKGPGLHWSWPYPIDEVVRIPYSEFQQVQSSIGWYFSSPEREALNITEPAGASINPAIDGYVISGDGNILHARATLYYKVADSIRYRFDFVSASNAVQNALDNAMVYAAARTPVDDILTRERLRFQEAVRARVSGLIASDKENLGVSIERCEVRAIPPRQLKDSFDAVLTAVSTRDKVLKDAESDQNKITNNANAHAAAIVNAARAESDGLVKSVQAESKYFSDLLPLYQANPGLIVNILLFDSFGQVLTNAQEKWYVPERADGKPWEIRLQLNREPLSFKTNNPAEGMP